MATNKLFPRQTAPVARQTPSPFDRLLGDQYTYPSQMNRVGGTYGQPQMDAGQYTLPRSGTHLPIPEPMSNFDEVPNEVYNSPYYQARRARNAMGKGSPYIPGGQDMTAGQRQQGYADMVAGMAGQQGSQPMNSRQFALANGYQGAMPQQPSMNPMTPEAPAMTPMQRLLGGQNPNMNYTPSWDSQVSRGTDGLINKQMPANSREELLSRTNRDTERLAAINALGQSDGQGGMVYNTDGRFFQGAQAVVPANGRAYFRDAPTPQRFTPEESEMIRRNNYMKLEASGAGYYNPQLQAFIGERAQGLPRAQLQGRLAAGGYTTPTQLNQSQLDGNRLAMLTRLQGNRDKAMARVQQLAQASTAERRARMNPSPMDRLMANNPQMAAAMQMQNAQMQHAMNLQNLQNQGELGVANARAKGEVDAMNRRGMWAAAVNGNEAAANQVGLVPDAAGLPKFAQGAFAGADKATFDFLKEQAANMNDDDLLSLMEEMSVPGTLQAGLLNRVKPNWMRGWGKAKASADGGGKFTGIPLPGGYEWGPFGLQNTRNYRSAQQP